MLPTILSDCLCSLQQNVRRIAFVMDLVICDDVIIETSFSKAQENCGQKQQQQHKDTKMLLKILKYTWTMQDCKYE